MKKINYNKLLENLLITNKKLLIIHLDRNL